MKELRVLAEKVEKDFLTIRKPDLPKALDMLKGARIDAISGVDTGKGIDVIYHFSADGQVVSLKVNLPRNDLKIETITKKFPGAELFERELMDMLGIKILNHPDPRRLFLPEDWKEGPPLRKEYQEVRKKRIR